MPQERISPETFVKKLRKRGPKPLQRERVKELLRAGLDRKQVAKALDLTVASIYYHQRMIAAEKEQAAK